MLAASHRQTTEDWFPDLFCDVVVPESGIYRSDEKMARGGGRGKAKLALMSLLRKERSEKVCYAKFSVIVFPKKRVLLVFDKT